MRQGVVLGDPARVTTQPLAVFTLNKQKTLVAAELATGSVGTACLLQALPLCAKDYWTRTVESIGWNTVKF